MEFLYLLEKIRTVVGDVFFGAITYLGDEIAFLALAILFYWCISKRQGYYILLTGVVGSVINQWLKIVCRIPRPWNIDPTFTTVGNSKVAATGFSFPSGHTQNVTGTFGCIGSYNRQRWLKISCVVIILLVSFSRMYLGVHTPLDVATSLGIAALLVFAFGYIFRTEESAERAMPWVILGGVLISLGFIIYMLLLDGSTFVLDYEQEGLYSARKNASTLAGCLFGLALVYPLDKYYIKFETKGRWYAQVIKFVVGLGIVYAIKAGLSSPLESLFGNEFIARAVRYFLIVSFAGGVWPLTFKYFGKVRIEKLEAFTEWLKTKFKKAEAKAE